MKIQASLISLSVAVTVPLVAQSRAQAVEITSDKTSWLQANIASLSDRKESKSHRTGHKLSSPDSGEMVASGVRLRPFVPNRKLPRQKDLEMALISQTPVMAAPSATLAGEISTYEPAPISPYRTPPNSVSGLTQHNGARVHVSMKQHQLDRAGQDRSIENISRPACEKTLGEELASEADNADPPPIALQRFNPQLKGTDFANLFGQKNPANSGSIGSQVGALLSPNSCPNQQATAQSDLFPLTPSMTANRSFDTNFDNISIPGEAVSNVGPPPFPLSLLPESQLRQLIRGSRVKNNVQGPPSYFGAWHAGQRQLAGSGFHSYIHSMNPRPNCYAHYCTKPMHAQTHHISHVAKAIEHVKQMPKNELKVAIYPMYHSPFQLSSY